MQTMRSLDMKGWDIVSVMPISYVNQMLAQNADKLLSDFSVSVDGDAAQGNLTNWRIVAGTLGNIGANISLQASIRNAKGVPNTDITIKTALSFVPCPTDNKVHELKFSFVSTDGDVPDGDLVVSGLDDMGNALLQTALIAHKNQISLVFAAVTTQVQNNGLVALPKPCFFAYTDKNGNCFFIIAGKTDGNEGTYELDDVLLSPKPSVGISGGVFLDKMVRPHISTYDDAYNISYFNFTGYSLQGMLNFFVSVVRGQGNVDLSIDKDKLCVHVGGSGEGRMGEGITGADIISVSFDWHYNNPVVFDTATRTLDIKMDPDPHNPPPYVSGNSFASLFSLKCGHNTISDSLKKLGTNIASLPGLQQLQIQWTGISSNTISDAFLGGNLAMYCAD